MTDVLLRLVRRAPRATFTALIAAVFALDVAARHPGWSCRHVANFITTMNSRSMTVYLWHSTAIIVGYQLLWRLPFALPYGVFSAALLALTAVAPSPWSRRSAGSRTSRRADARSLAG